MFDAVVGTGTVLAVIGWALGGRSMVAALIALFLGAAWGPGITTGTQAGGIKTIEASEG